MKLEELLKQYKELETVVALAKTKMTEISDQIKTELFSEGKKTDLVDLDEWQYKVTVVERETVSFDDSKIEKYIGKRAFNKICKQTIDRKLLEVGIKTGEIPEGVLKYATVTKSSPYLRITQYNGEPDE